MVNISTELFTLQELKVEEASASRGREDRVELDPVDTVLLKEEEEEKGVVARSPD